ncbi:MAG TPA: CehA/McbA family metallohydrolase [Anaerolineae bacterium]|nr:CehA/McbA family metallohydrolase [Anaerolineae bacterium]
MPQQTQLFEGDFVPSQEKEYVHLPFEMPHGATRLDVEYSYSHQIDSDPLLHGGNTIDLGVFDERGIEFLNAGFRGWSGSERLAFFITETEATPGYLAGALTPGVWHIGLGLYKIADEGCQYRVAVTITTDANSTSSLSRPRIPSNLPSSPIQSRRGNWLRGEMHCHTIHSDGDSTPEKLLQIARERGLDFLAITDHNSISCQRELETFSEPGLILIRGVEVTTFKGHFNVWGILDWIDFRVTCPEQMAAAIRAATDKGALTSCNHPKPYGPMWDYGEVEGYHCIEVWNGPWIENNESALKFWAERLAHGKRIVAVCGSDWHTLAELEQEHPRAPGTPTLWVYVPETPSADAILNAIHRGHVTLSDEPNGAFLELCAGDDLSARGGDVLTRDSNDVILFQVHCLNGAGNTLTLLDQKGIVFSQRIQAAEETVRARVPVKDSLYIRAELRGDDDIVHALTNPIYFQA